MTGEDRKMSIAGTISVAAAKKGLEKVVDDIYGLSKGGVQKQVNRWRAKASITRRTNERICQICWYNKSYRNISIKGGCS